MLPLHRHQLAWITDAAWPGLLAQARDAVEQACLAHWAVQGLPLVVTQQPPAGVAPAGRVALGLPAPSRWQRRRMALRAPGSALQRLGEFPTLARVAERLGGEAQPQALRLCQGLHALGLRARVYGSHGWQALSGLDHVHPRSDLDVWIDLGPAPGAADQMDQDTGCNLAGTPACTTAQAAMAHRADLAAALLQACAGPGPRLDGELVLSDGHAVAWREWLAWRRGESAALLVKSLGAPRLVDRLSLLWQRPAT